MFEEIFSMLHGDIFYKEFSNEVPLHYWDLIEILRDGDHQIQEIRLCEDATDPWERNIPPGKENNTPEEYDKLSPDVFIGVDNIIITFLNERTLISYDMHKPRIYVETTESDFTLDAYLFAWEC